MHFKGTVYTCKTCDNKYKTKKELTNHEYAHRDVIFPCPHCKQTFQTKSGRNKHVKKHFADTAVILPEGASVDEETFFAIVPNEGEEEVYEEYEELDEVGFVNIV